MATAWTNLENKFRTVREGSCLHETLQAHLLRTGDIVVVIKSEGNATLPWQDITIGKLSS
jgi:hypothetical protein